MSLSKSCHLSGTQLPLFSRRGNGICLPKEWREAFLRSSGMQRIMVLEWKRWAYNFWLLVQCSFFSTEEAIQRAQRTSRSGSPGWLGSGDSRDEFIASSMHTVQAASTGLVIVIVTPTQKLPM